MYTVGISCFSQVGIDSRIERTEEEKEKVRIVVSTNMYIVQRSAVCQGSEEKEYHISQTKSGS